MNCYVNSTKNPKINELVLPPNQVSLASVVDFNSIELSDGIASSYVITSLTLSSEEQKIEQVPATELSIEEAIEQAEVIFDDGETVQLEHNQQQLIGMFYKQFCEYLLIFI